MDLEIDNTKLRWPDGQLRTRLQDRKPQAQWKKTYLQSVESLTKELKRLGATAALLTHNSTGNEDGGVAVYFSLKPINNFGWQEALGFIGEVPTISEIDRAYMSRVKKIHPDGPTPDLVLFRTLTEHRDQARAFARGEQRVEHDKVMACDTFKEARLNINALRLTFAAMRQIERCGSAVLMERAWRGFTKALITAGGTNDVATIA